MSFSPPSSSIVIVYYVGVMVLYGVPHELYHLVTAAATC